MSAPKLNKRERDRLLEINRGRFPGWGASTKTNVSLAHHGLVVEVGTIKASTGRIMSYGVAKLTPDGHAAVKELLAAAPWMGPHA